jgi:hypothetical protein
LFPRQRIMVATELWQRQIRYNDFLKDKTQTETLEGGDLYLVLPKLWSEVRPVQDWGRERIVICQQEN